MSNTSEAQVLAWVEWEASAQRLTLELALPTGDEWDKRPRDMRAAVHMAEAALATIKCAFGLEEPHPDDVIAPPSGRGQQPSPPTARFRKGA